MSASSRYRLTFRRISPAGDIPSLSRDIAMTGRPARYARSRARDHSRLFPLVSCQPADIIIASFASWDNVRPEGWPTGRPAGRSVSRGGSSRVQARVGYGPAIPGLKRSDRRHHRVMPCLSWQASHVMNPRGILPAVCNTGSETVSTVTLSRRKCQSEIAICSLVRYAGRLW